MQLSTSTKKIISLLDEVKTTACSKTLLFCEDPNKLMEDFLDHLPELVEPINAIIKSHFKSLLFPPLLFLSGVRES